MSAYHSPHPTMAAAKAGSSSLDRDENQLPSIKPLPISRDAVEAIAKQGMDLLKKEGRHSPILYLSFSAL